MVVIVGGCCEVSTGSRAPPRLELTLLTHHAPCHNLTQRNATRRTTTPHSTMERHPPRRSTTHPNMGPRNLTQPTAPQPNASPHKSPQSPSSPSCSPHPYPTQRDWQSCAPPGWEGFSCCCLRIGSLENPRHPPSMGALTGALCGCGGCVTLAVPGTETPASCRQDPALSAKELAEGTAVGYRCHQAPGTTDSPSASSGASMGMDIQAATTRSNPPAFAPPKSPLIHPLCLFQEFPDSPGHHHLPVASTAPA